jgi:hypothetical protein
MILGFYLDGMGYCLTLSHTTPFTAAFLGFDVVINLFIDAIQLMKSNN